MELANILKSVKEKGTCEILTDCSQSQIDKYLRPHKLTATPLWFNGKPGFTITQSVQFLKPELNHTLCQVSTGICGSITCGQGELSDNGYWEFPCAVCEAKFD